MSLLGAVLSFVGGLVASSIASRDQNRNIQASLNAQKEENEKMREYNMSLARQQNQYNVAQWERENQALQDATINEREYNSPVAQIQRLRDSGLNADMYYGNGSLVNTSSAYGVASSPSLTAGAAASSMDWSALAGKKTIGQTISESLALQQARANIEATKAQTRKTDAEAGGQEISNEFAAIEKALGVELTKSQIDLNKAELKRINADVERLQAVVVNLDADTANKALDHVFKTKSMEHELHILANKSKMSDADVSYTMKTLMARVAYQDALSDKARSEADEAGSKADIAKWQADTVLWNEFLKVWDKGIRTFETYLEFKGFIDETTEFFDRDGEGEVISKTTQRRRRR